MIRYVYQSTFGKQDHANPLRSSIGCGVGMFLMILVAAGITWVFSPKGELAEMQRAEREIGWILDAFREVLADAEVESIAEVFEEGALTPLDSAAARLTRDTAWAAALLHEGRAADLPLREDLRERLQPRYLRQVEQDPWGQPYRVWLGPAAPEVDAVFARRSEGYRAPVLVFSTGKNGAPDQPYARAGAEGGDDIVSWDRDAAWESHYTGG